VFISAVCLALLVRHLITQREMKRLTKEIRKISSHAGHGARLYLDEHNSTLERLTDAINHNINEYEKKIRRAESMEENVQLSITAISHDLRTPLTSLKGYLQLVMKETQSEKRSEYMKIIETNINTMTDLTENFYDLSRLETDESIFAPQPINLSRTVCERFLGFYERFTEKGIEVTIQETNTDTTISADPQAIDRVIYNLIQNLLRYAKTKVEVTFTDEENHIRLTITNDTSTPLPEPTEKIFERFYTSNQSRISKNAGIGLYVSKKLVENMHGQLTAHSTNNNIQMNLSLPKTSKP